MLGISSDGDPRLLNAMKCSTKFCIDGKLEDDILFTNLSDTEFVCIQDTIHAGLKLRNRYLKPSIILPIGNKVISVSHLKILINSIEKDVHGVVMKDICPEDKQNFKSLEKIMDQKVLDALSKYVIESEATVMYLKLCSEIVSSYNKADLSPIDRVYRIFHATYFLRIWRMWILRKSKQNLNGNEKHYSLSNNFISSNAYVCVEINAHNLVRLIRKLRDSNLEKLFLPYLFASQPCEETFRQLRSMGTINFTKINFSMLEVIHMIHRIEVQNDIVYSKLSNLDVNFPRNRIQTNHKIKFRLPNDNDIKIAMSTAKEDAIKDAMTFGMEVDCNTIVYCNINEISINELKNKKRKIEEIYLKETSSVSKVAKIECTNTKDYSCSHDQLLSKCTSPFVEVETQDGKMKTIRKSTMVWLMTDSKESLSNDRLKRVQSATQTTSCKKRLNFKKNFTQKKLSKEEEIQIGDCCIFQNDTIKSNQNNSDLIFGVVIGFKYKKGDNEKQKQYTWEFAPIETNLPEEKRRGITVLASWFQFNFNGSLHPVKDISCFYVDITNYVVTLPHESIEKTNSGLLIKTIYLEDFQQQITACLNNNNK